MLKSLVSESDVAGKMATQIQIHCTREETSVSYIPVEDVSSESAHEAMVDQPKKRRIAKGGGGGGGGRRRRWMRMRTMSSWVADCCPAGCVAGFIGCIYFFVIVPTGVLLTWHGHSNDAALTFGLGISVLLVSTFVIPSILITVHYFHKMRSIRMMASLDMSDTSILEAGVEKIDMRIVSSTSPVVHPSDTVA